MQKKKVKVVKDTRNGTVEGVWELLILEIDMEKKEVVEEGGEDGRGNGNILEKGAGKILEDTAHPQPTRPHLLSPTLPQQFETVIVLYLNFARTTFGKCL